MAEITRDIVDQMLGLIVIEFGASWCGHCRSCRPAVDALLVEHPNIRHIRIEDGPGLPLGRSFHVKLWPTFIFLRDGSVIERVVRPSDWKLAQGSEWFRTTGVYSAVGESLLPIRRLGGYAKMLSEALGSIRLQLNIS